MEDCKINILGEEWKVVYLEESEDEMLKQADGYIDYTIKTIVVCKMKQRVGNVAIVEYHMKKVARHEVIHAFLYESGLRENSLRYENGWSNNEEMVDWFAIQGDKVFKAWKEAGLI